MTDRETFMQAEDYPVTLANHARQAVAELAYLRAMLVTLQKKAT